MKTWTRLNSCSVKGKLINLYIWQVRITSVLHRKHHLATKNIFIQERGRGQSIPKDKYAKANM